MLKWTGDVRPEDARWNYVISLGVPRNVFTMRHAPAKEKPASLTSVVTSLTAKVE